MNLYVLDTDHVLPVSLSVCGLTAINTSCVPVSTPVSTPVSIFIARLSSFINPSFHHSMAAKPNGLEFVFAAVRLYAQ